MRTPTKRTGASITAEPGADSIDRLTGSFTPRRNASPTPHTYLVAAENSISIKIGYAGNPKSRLADLQIGQPFQLTLLHVWQGDYERELHHRFAPQRVRGEWFDLTPLGDPVAVIQAAIDEIRASAEVEQQAPAAPEKRTPPALSVDLTWILEVARVAGDNDPSPDDFGVPLAAVERHRAVLFDQDVYGGACARAAALAHTLGRLCWLERSNMTVAVAVCVGYLQAAGRTVKPGPDEISGLVDELLREECTAKSVAALLRSWPS